MASLSAKGVNTSGASLLGVTRHTLMTIGADVLRAVGSYVVIGLALVTPSGIQSGGIRDNDRLSLSSRFHNHL